MSASTLKGLLPLLPLDHLGTREVTDQLLSPPLAN